VIPQDRIYGDRIYGESRSAATARRIASVKRAAASGSFAE
jgi:hypothetical protein